MKAAAAALLVLIAALFAGGVHAQDQVPVSPPQMVADPQSTNPMSILSSAGSMLPGQGQNEISDSGPADGGGLSAAINVMILLSVITLVPSILLMTTSFVRILVVLGLLRQAIGT